MRTEFILVIVLATCASALAADRSADSLSQLSMLCRQAIERAEQLDVNGLIDLGPSTTVVEPLIVEGLAEPLVPGWKTREHSWQLPGSAFMVVEEVRDGPSFQRACIVKLVPSAPALTPQEEASFVAEFLRQRALLIAAGTHEERNPAPIYSTNLGVGPLEWSASGCSIISGLQIETRLGHEPFFRSLSAEQTFCETPHKE
jgi:hypothetical protein